MTVRKELIEQINLIIKSIKTNNQKNPTPMVKNILKRYEEAKEFIKHSTEEQFEEDLSKVRNKLDTLTRAYLESANDYMNPMLREMHKTEKLLKKYDETGKS
ncbi:hypothetical protein [Bacillus subtilis]|uniref:hypothetical protein n=1 Tax=Bacillus subtilis TaxID=1423 RepID=UPI00102ED12C|nr:hypothetical protein [Bacillus subtilis]TAH79841.1 hypothetical protein ES060_17065 [Bacillus subtilis]TAH86876.1 hypothetical protein ES066_17070 [Bacillus subtilis]TWG63384.1 hypothetical protein L607_000500002060 [Bacillus subtilis J24]TWG72011.1 hypothetical protein L605_000400002060 [Bacillus subtilis J26]